MSVLTCAVCERPMRQAPKSLPQGEARCHSCRRNSRGERPTTCAYCGKAFESRTSRSGWSRFCSARCANRANSEDRRVVERICEWCGKSFMPSHHHDGERRQRYCAKACWLEATAQVASCPVYFPSCSKCGVVFVARRSGVRTCPEHCGYQPLAGSTKIVTCKTCGGTFPYVITGPGSGPTYCPPCAKTASRVAQRNVRALRRARKRGVAYEYVIRRKVFERDGYVCYLCDKQLAPETKVPHPDAPTIDHVRPLAKGGAHTYANIRTACFMCNALKSDRWEGTVGGPSVAADAA